MQGQRSFEIEEKKVARLPFIKDLVPDQNYRRLDLNSEEELLITTLGVGTHSGSSSSETDLQMFNGVVDSGKFFYVNNKLVISKTVNNIDTSLSFRFMKSERVVGSALKFLQDYKQFERNEVFLSSKGGFIQEDADNQIHFEDALKNMFKDPTSNL